MNKRQRLQYPIDWVRIEPNTHFAQAKNCLLYIQLGDIGIYIGSGMRPKGYGARLELFTNKRADRRFGWHFHARGGVWHSMNGYEWKKHQERYGNG